VQSTKLRVADVELELLDTGQGAAARARPILFLHGGGGFSPQQPFVAPLAEKRRFVAPTHPGFGKSTLPDWLDSIDDIAHLYLELMDILQLDGIHLVGCSIGGWIAAEMATKSPERFRRIVFCGPVGVKVGPPDKLDIPDIFAMAQADALKLTFHDPERMKPDTAKMSDDELAAMFRARETLALLTWEPWMHNPKLKRRLHRVASPTLFIRGESDGLVSEAYLDAYARLLPDARTMTIKAAGHVPQLEQPAAFAAAVLEFLGE
jgi:pimeloyl-ACP methyl ester carboxylesterase